MKKVKKFLKIAGIVLGCIVALATLFYIKVYFSTESRRNKTFEITAQAVALSTDSATLAHGARLTKAKGCVDCHGADLGGKIFIDDPALGFLVGANLTKGTGGLPQEYSTEDWVLALKHGVDHDRKTLLFMPSQEFTLLTEQDMGAIISYCNSLAPIDRVLPGNSIGPVGRLLTDLDKLPLFPAEKIDHTRALVKDIRVEISPAFGEYISTSCEGCHRKHMKGGDPVAPGFPPVADISSTGNPGKWTDEQFIETLRTGVTPEGKTLDPENMPWPMAKEMTDIELKALHLYLKTL